MYFLNKHAHISCRPCCCGTRWLKVFRIPSDETFTVTYIANGGTGQFVDRGLPDGSFYTVKSADQTGITRAGYTLIGWNTQPDGSGEAFKVGVGLNIRENLTLYAQWEPDGTQG